MYHVTMVFPVGPTTLPPDQETVTVRRAEATAERVAKLHAAALLLGATRVDVESER